MPSSPRDGKLSWRKGDLLGAGAFGKVYKCLDDRTGRLIAVKELTFQPNNRKEMEELKLEVSLLRQLEHKHIVQYLGAQMNIEESSRSGCIMYIVTEFMSGGSVLSLIKQYGEFTEQVARQYTHQILLGLEYLHSKNIIHRDIKPANVLVDEHGVVKLADFGASKQMKGSVTNELENQTLKGTPYFMAPEVLTQSGHGRRADIWSVGATALQMVTGTPPWKSLRFDSIVQLDR